MKPLGKLFLERKQSRGLGVHVRHSTRKARGRGARPPPGRTLHPRGPLVAPLMYFFRLYISIYPQNFREHNRSAVPLLQASVATKNLSGAHSGALSEGESLTCGHPYYSGAFYDEEGVVHPRG